MKEWRGTLSTGCKTCEKKMNLNVVDKVIVEVNTDPEMQSVLEEHRQYICTETQATALLLDRPLDHAEEIDLDERSLRINILTTLN